MKNIKLHIIAFTFITIFFYMLGSFIEVSFNNDLWKDSFRYEWSVVYAIVLAIVVMVIEVVNSD